MLNKKTLLTLRDILEATDSRSQLAQSEIDAFLSEIDAEINCFHTPPSKQGASDEGPPPGPVAV